MNATQKKAREKLKLSLESKDGLNKKYVQHLFKLVDIDKDLLKKKDWKYGYNEEHNFVVISKDGTIGEVYEIQGLRIAIPSAPKDIFTRSKDIEKQYWESHEVPAFIKKTQSVYQFNETNSESVKLQWSDYINEEFDRRDDGYWFMNKGEPTYVTGSHYMYLQWTKTDAELVEYRKSNQLFFYFWEACKADNRCYGMCYLKNRRSGFSFMASAETVNLATITKDSRYGILSKTGDDAKKLFVDKVVPIANNYPFFFKPIQDGQEKPKTELSYKKPSKKLTSKALKNFKEDDGLGEGLDTSIDWKTTGDYSYDGEKLKLLLHDESGKWDKDKDIKKNWRVTKTCLRLGRRIIGKCMMGSTAGALDSGGEQYKDIYWDSNLLTTQRNDNGQTPTGLYSLFIPMEWNYEGYIDKYGDPVFNDPETPIEDIWGDTIKKGVISYWRAEVAGLKHDSDSLNAYYRQFPMSENHAFRDESENSLFNLVKLNDQIDYNEDLYRDNIIARGNFGWVNDERFGTVTFYPNKDGRFHITKVLPPSLQNNVVIKDGLKCPGNEHIGSFGCDPYDISGTVGKGSNGALHGLSKYHMEEFPTNQFFLEYISRPATADIFYEDMLMAIVFYGMPVLVENNRPGFLKYLARNGYRGFSMNRPDKKYSKLSVAERELGGVPNSGPQMIHDHANAINTYIEHYVGVNIETDEMGSCYFNRTLLDWSRFDINKRTDFDASISSGLAIMANQRLNYKPRVIRERKQLIEINMGQRGPNGKLIYSK